MFNKIAQIPQVIISLSKLSEKLLGLLGLDYDQKVQYRNKRDHQYDRNYLQNSTHMKSDEKIFQNDCSKLLVVRGSRLRLWRSIDACNQEMN